MSIEKTTKDNNAKVLTDKEFFETIQIAKTQYETYIQLTTYSLDEKSDSPYNTIKRDINHPLNIVIK